MNNKLIYYQIPASKATDIPLVQDYRMKVYYPRVGRLNLHTQFKPIYLFWYLFTFARYSIYYVYDAAGRIIHFCHVKPKIFKYAFMPSKNSIHIGPCWTDKNHRGKRIYPAVLSRICADYPQKDVYIFTDDDNISSQKGIEKVGFKRFATGFKTKLLGIYKIALR